MITKGRDWRLKRRRRKKSIKNWIGTGEGGEGLGIGECLKAAGIQGKGGRIRRDKREQDREEQEVKE